MRYLLSILLLPLALSAAVNVGPNGTGGAYSFSTTVYNTTTNVPNPLTNGTIVVTQSLTAQVLNIGLGASTTTLTSTNGPVSEGMPFVLWNEWTAFNTNSIFATNGPATFNGPYTWMPTLNVWSNTAATAILTNTGTALLRASGYGGAVTASNGYSGSPFPATNWYSLTGGTNLFVRVHALTNTCWRAQTYGPITNWLDYSNGIGGSVYSNGAAYQVTSRVAGTNKSWTLISAAP